MSIVVEDDVPRFVEQFEVWGRGVRELLVEKVRQLTGDLYHLVQDVALDGGALDVRTGRLRASLYQRIEDTGEAVTGVVGTQGVPYASVQEHGGRSEYLIFPIKAQALSFFWEKVGAKVFFAYVLHPALKARRYLSGSLETMAPLISAELNAIVQTAVREGI